MYFLSSATLATVALLAQQTLAQGSTPGCGTGLMGGKNTHRVAEAEDCNNKGNTWTCSRNTHVVVNSDNTILLAAPNVDATVGISCDGKAVADYYCHAGKQSLFPAPCANPSAVTVLIEYH
ncbi:hypothetical protein E4U55_003417 [Claviceps digitariae]|nr:hypothetical protein E4U55_003417 [Claviceps digitariae]